MEEYCEREFWRSIAVHYQQQDCTEELQSQDLGQLNVSCFVGLSGSGVWAQSTTLTDAAGLHCRKASSANKRPAWVFTAPVSAMLEEFSFTSVFAGGPELAQERSVNLRMILLGL